MINLLTREQKAKELGISTRTLSRLVKIGKVKFIQLTPESFKKSHKWYFTNEIEALTNYYLGIPEEE